MVAVLAETPVLEAVRILVARALAHLDESDRELDVVVMLLRDALTVLGEVLGDRAHAIDVMHRPG